MVVKSLPKRRYGTSNIDLCTGFALYNINNSHWIAIKWVIDEVRTAFYVKICPSSTYLQIWHRDFPHFFIPLSVEPSPNQIILIFFCLLYGIIGLFWNISFMSSKACKIGQIESIFLTPDKAFRLPCYFYTHAVSLASIYKYISVHYIYIAHSKSIYIFVTQYIVRFGTPCSLVSTDLTR